MESISLSQALPQEDDREDLVEGISFCITGIVLEDRTFIDKVTREPREYKAAKINGLSIDGSSSVKYHTSASVVVKTLQNLLTAACYMDGACKKPVRVSVEGRDGMNGRYLVLVDA